QACASVPWFKAPDGQVFAGEGARATSMPGYRPSATDSRWLLLLGGDLPPLVGTHQIYGGAGRVTVVEISAVLFDQGGTIPSVETLYQRAGSIKIIPQLVGNPLPGVLHRGVIDAGHGDVGNLNQLAFRQGNSVGNSLVGILPLLEARDRSQALAGRRECDHGAAARCFGGLDRAYLFQQTVMGVAGLLVHAGHDQAAVKMDDRRALGLEDAFHHAARFPG